MARSPIGIYLSVSLILARFRTHKRDSALRADVLQAPKLRELEDGALRSERPGMGDHEPVDTFGKLRRGVERGRMGQGRRQFTDEFKREAVALPASSGRGTTRCRARTPANFQGGGGELTPPLVPIIRDLFQSTRKRGNRARTIHCVRCGIRSDDGAPCIGAGGPGWAARYRAWRVGHRIGARRLRGRLALVYSARSLGQILQQVRAQPLVDPHQPRGSPQRLPAGRACRDRLKFRTRGVSGKRSRAIVSCSSSARIALSVVGEVGPDGMEGRVPQPAGRPGTGCHCVEHCCTYG
jgi:hypothetical protein